MTISSVTNRSGPYNGNGVTTVFDYTFKIFSSAHLSVIKKSVAGVETTLALGAGYSVSGVGVNTGGQVTVTAAPATGETITILPNVPNTQTLDLQSQGAYNAEDVEAAFDLAVMRDKQMTETLARAVVIPASSDPALLTGLVSNILRLGASAANIDTVAVNVANVNLTAGSIANVNIVGNVIGNVNTVAVSIASVNTVSGAVANVNTVAGAIANVNSVAGNIANVNAVAGNAANINAANGYATTATTKAGEAAASATAANTSKNNAATSETNAAGSATAAAGSATAANTSKLNAATSETNAATSATNSANSAAAAAASAAGMTTVEVQIVGAAAVTTIGDTDVLAHAQTAGPVLKKITWANVKATLWTAWGALIAGGTNKATPVAADKIAIADSAAANATKYVSLTQMWVGYFQGIADGLYAAAAHTHTFASLTAKPTTIAGFAITDAITTAGGSTSGEIKSTLQDNWRIKQGSYGAFWRNDGTNYYLLFTAAADQDGTFNALRPLTVALTTGAVTFGSAVQANSTLNTTGTLSENGNRVYSAANPPPASTDTYNAVGSYMLVRAETSVSIPANGAVAGSNIKPCSAGGINTSSLLSGTWRGHGVGIQNGTGTSGADAVTLAIRTA